MTNKDKAEILRAAMDSEALVLGFEGRHLTANAIKDFLWNCDEHILCRLFDRVARIAA